MDDTNKDQKNNQHPHPEIKPHVHVRLETEIFYIPNI